MSAFTIIEHIQSAQTVGAVEECETWINKYAPDHAGDLADIALRKKIELLTSRYPIEE